jgi:sulfur carrier protein
VRSAGISAGPNLDRRPLAGPKTGPPASCRPKKIAKRTRPMTVTVNGKPHPLTDGTTLAALVEQLNFGPKRLAIEVNKELVTRTEWPGCVLKDGDTIEIVSFVGGG